MLVDKLCERYNKDPAKCKAICRRIGLRFVITVLVLIIILLNLIWFNLIKAFDLTKPKPRLLSVSDDEQGYYNMFLKNSKKYDSKVMLYRDKSQQWLNMLEHNHDFHYDPDTMTLLNENFYALNCFKFQPYIANGYIGSKISNLGFGFTYDQNVPNIENGWPLRNQRYTGSYISDFYSLQEKLNSTNFPELDDLGYSTVISSIPYWNDMIIEFDDAEYESFINKRILKPSSLESLNPAHFREYKQMLSMKNGIIKTSYIWMDSIKIEIECFANKKYHSMSSISINIEILNKTRVKNLKIINLLDFKTSERTELIDLGYKINSSTTTTTGGITGTTTFQDSDSELIYMVVSPDNVHEYSNAAIISKLMFPSYMTKNKDYSIQYETNGNEPDCIEQIVSLTNPDLEKFEIFKLVSIHSTELTNSLQNLEISLKELNNHKTIQDYYHLKNIHINRWFDFYSMNCFIEIPSDILLELSIRSSIFHLISNLREDNVLPNRGLPVSPSGLSSDSYGGMVFWDSDYWIIPAMIPFFPKAAKNMIMYRNATLPQAIENANFYNQSGAIYPWTAGRYSNCTSTGPCIDYEYHINIDIVWSSLLYYMSGNYDMINDQFDDETYLRYTLWPLVYQVTTYFENYVTYDSINDQFTTKNLTDPDEFANFIDNGAYTNFGIKMLFVWAIDIGRHLEIPFPKKWFDIREKMYIPENSQGDITLEYTGMNSTIRTKQADVLLNIYPFGIFHKFPNYQKSVNNLYFYTEHQAYDGPAMSYQIYVAVANYLLNQGCSSQSFLYKSLIPYLRLPWAQFSEQANDLDPLTKPAFPFLTANGGFLQSIIYGITGIRFNYEVDKKTKKISRFMEFNPIQLKVLPGGISIKNFKYMNGILDIIIGDEKAILKYKFGKSPITIKVPDRNKLHILDGTVNSIEIFKTYKLRPNTQLELDLFPVESNMKDDVAECKLITNLTVGVPGDVAISLIDGNNYTHWQAIDHNRATFLIDIGSNNEKVINSATILWGNRPAKNVSVYILPMDDFNYDEIPFFFTPTNLSVYDSAYDDWNEDNTLMDQKINQLEVMIAMGAFTEKDLMRWFVPLVEGQEVVPSVPYNKYDTTNNDIKISKNNETTILFDYDCDVIPQDSVFGKHNPAKKPVHRQFDCNDLSKYKARFILVSVEGVYGYDDDDDYLNDKEVPVIERFGATIREIALF